MSDFGCFVARLRAKAALSQLSSRPTRGSSIPRDVVEAGLADRVEGIRVAQRLQKGRSTQAGVTVRSERTGPGRAWA